MRILHIYNTANVPGILAKYLRLEGHEVSVYSNDRADYFRQGESYGGVIPIQGDPVPAALKVADDFDIIHCHSIPHQIKKIRTRCPDSKIILHYHGNDTRKHTAELDDYVDKYLCSTPTLVRDDWTYLPNPVDPTFWVKRKKTGNKYLWMKQWCGEDKGDIGKEWDIIEKEVIHRSKNKGFDLEIVKRWIQHVPYRYMQEIFFDDADVWIEYKPYVDYGKGRTMSLTSMEALLCGLRVYYLVEDLYIDSFPVEHMPEHVVDMLLKIYEEVIG